MKTTNHYTGYNLGQMTLVIAAIRKGVFTTPEWATERRFAILEVTERLMALHDETQQEIRRISIRSWVGDIQEIEGLNGLGIL